MENLIFYAVAYVCLKRVRVFLVNPHSCLTFDESMKPMRLLKTVTSREIFAKTSWDKGYITIKYPLKRKGVSNA